MKEVTEASQEDGFVLNKSETDKVCSNCGYDLTAEEIEAATCADCGEALTVKTSVSVWAADRPK
jgi:predicted RNA-binding Zn-ribbon protein involved in translation (DUF1610 family)